MVIEALKDLTAPKEKTITGFDVILMVLSFFVLASLIVEAFIKISPEVAKLLRVLDTGVCMVFLYDFIVRFKAAPSKWKFMKWGWIDLVSSIPIHGLVLGQSLRIIRFFRVLRGVRSLRYLFSVLFAGRVKSAFASMLLVGIVLVSFSAIAILHFEPNAEGSNIKNASDALWWSIVTVATVGYGDKFPVTLEGRVVASVAMVAGIGLFGTLSGYITSWFMARERGGNTNDQIMEEIQKLRAEIQEFKK